MGREQYQIEAERLIATRIAQLRSLTFDRASALPEAAGEEPLIAGRKCALTTFRQQLTPAEVLVTVQVARPTALGLASVHTEKGLIFRRDGSVREASRDELLASGG
jgi:hypothetical protein